MALAEMTLREELQGVELRFKEKPPRDILDQLGRGPGGLGFRWHNQGKYWFAKQTPERLEFARRMAGMEAEKAPEADTYRYWSTQRPVDLGTYPKAGGAFIGFENFERRQAVEDGSFMAWGWLDYSRPLTEKELADYELRPTQSTLNKTSKAVSHTQVTGQPPKPEAKKETAKSAPNTFAANYERVGDIQILDSSDISFFDFRAAYFKDLNLFVERTGCGDCLTILSLDNAGKTGKVCQEWKLSVKDWPRDDVCTKLNNEHDFHTVKELWEKCLGDQDTRVTFMLDTEDIRVSNYQRKGSNVFSPFIETKPLTAVPEKWTKKNFTQGLMSGQIYCGEVRNHQTDDYAFDAANGFLSGVRLDMPNAARDAVEGWSTLSSVSTSGAPDEKGVYMLDFSDGAHTYKNMWLDLNCDIAEGKRREEARAAGIRQFNDMMKSSCIQVDAQSIDPGKVYLVHTLETNSNTGIMAATPENIQGHLLRSRIEDGYMGDILSVQEMDIQPDKLYQITNPFHRPTESLEGDERVICCGNWQSYVTGKALLELTAEGVYVPMLHEARDDFKTFERAQETLEKFIRGESWYSVSNLKPGEYSLALSRLMDEKNRVESAPKRSLDSMLRSAESRNTVQADHAAQRSKNAAYPDRG